MLRNDWKKFHAVPGLHPLRSLFCTLFNRGGNRRSRTKNQPKEEVFGTDVPRTSGGHSPGYPGPKLRSGHSKSWKKQAFGRGHSSPEGADVHDPKGLPKTSVKKNFGLNFRSLEGLLDYKGRAGIISIVRWNLRPVIFGADKSL